MKKADNLMEIAFEAADAQFLQMLDDYPILGDDDQRQESFLLCMMNNCISRLHVLGWKEKDLCIEVFDWCQQARDWMDKHSESD